mgnify:CR=1 FL=1
MCIRDRPRPGDLDIGGGQPLLDRCDELGDGEDDDDEQVGDCLLYTSDAADERSSVDLGGRRIIKKKTNITER